MRPETIPELPESRPLERADKPLLDTIFSEFPPAASEMTFTNLYAWCGTHPVFLSRRGQTALLWRGPAAKGVLLPPAGPPLEVAGIRAALSWAEKMGCPPEFGRLPAADARKLLDADPRLIMIDDRNNADYVYRTTDLAELPGRKYDGKRNFVKNFNRAVSARFRAIGPDILDLCKDVQSAWCDLRECSIHADLEDEDKAVRVVLEEWEYLKVFGGALMVDDRVAAFSVAEKLSDGVAVVHFEKAGPWPGAYQAINQELSRQCLDGFEFINREQDLGIEGLRKAKQSYHPDHLVEKYTVRY